MKLIDTDPEALETKSILVYSLDILPDKLVWGQHKVPVSSDPRNLLSLRIDQNQELVNLKGRYSVHENDPLRELERQLMRLSHQGVLHDATIFLGVLSDPLHPFNGKFDYSMKCLQLFKRYVPGKLIIQTRSPLLVIAMPVLQALKEQLTVTFAVETNSELSAQRYTPGLPRIEERIKAARAIQRFGISVTVSVAPLLPYGDWKKDAEGFAESICDVSNYIHLAPLCDGTQRGERRAKAMSVAKKLTEDRQFYWLRPDATVPLSLALQTMAPEKLIQPAMPTSEAKQIQLFG